MFFYDEELSRQKYTNNFLVTQNFKITTLYLATLEASFIESLEPSLCRQKEFVYGIEAFSLAAEESAQPIACSLFPANQRHRCFRFLLMILLRRTRKCLPRC